MKLLVLYRPRSEQARNVEEYTEEFRRRYPEADIELMDAESVEGVDESKLYDILQYPALVVTSNDGGLLNMWVGDNLPLMEEVAGYIHS